MHGIRGLGWSDPDVRTAVEKVLRPIREKERLAKEEKFRSKAQRHAKYVESVQDQLQDPFELWCTPGTYYVRSHFLESEWDDTDDSG